MNCIQNIYELLDIDKTFLFGAFNSNFVNYNSSIKAKARIDFIISEINAFKKLNKLMISEHHIYFELSKIKQDLKDTKFCYDVIKCKDKHHVELHNIRAGIKDLADIEKMYNSQLQVTICDKKNLKAMLKTIEKENGKQ